MRPSIEISSAECRHLLTSKTVGRLAFGTDNGLRILPVNYAVDDDRIVFRTTAYGVIARSLRGADVAFEVDDLDDELRSGWSVLAVGRCERLDDAEELTRIQQGSRPEPWASGSRDLYFALRWKGLSGRRLGESD